MSSRSLGSPPARTHFCTDTARLYGGVSSPVKYGLNGIMPAIVKSKVLSTGMTLADGTCWCARSVKNSTKARRSSSAVVGTSGICDPRLLAASRPHAPFELCFAHPHRLTTLRDRGPHRATPAVGHL